MIDNLTFRRWLRAIIR